MRACIYVMIFAALAAVPIHNCKAGEAAKAAAPRVVITTNLGDITLLLDAEKAPISVNNFLNYVEKGFYNNTIFHRVIPAFMIQTGGYLADLTEKETGPTIKNEADNGLPNVRGTVAMARTAVVDSATSQFFINTVDNGYLNYVSPTQYGYAVFGRVIEGMAVVDEIEMTQTHRKGDFPDIPVETISILSAKILTDD